MSTLDAASLRALREVTRVIEEGGFRLQGAWLFGSRARQNAGPDSDVDIAVLCDPPLGPERFRLQDRASLACGIDIDLVDLNDAAPGLAWEVLTTGQLIAEHDEVIVEDFLRKARYAAEDAEQRDRMVLLAQVEHVGGTDA